MEQKWRLQVNGKVLDISDEETLLAALNRQNYEMRVSCRNGVCGVCEFTLLSGSMAQRYPQKNLIASQDCKQAVVGLTCTSHAKSDILIEIDGLKRSGEIIVKKINCSIESVEKLNHDVYQVKLLLPATGSQSVEYYAGQYLDLCLPNGKSASFSIGSAPEAGRNLELHIRHNPESDFSNSLMEHLRTETTITAEVAKGDSFLQASSLSKDTRLILAAASTGFSQIKSIVEHLIAQNVENEIHIYWGVRVASDLYWSLLPEMWAAENENIIFHPLISDPTAECEWSGRTDLIPDAILQDFNHFDEVKVVASGSPAMVYALLDACEGEGMDSSQLLSDVLAYAPRPEKK